MPSISLKTMKQAILDYKSLNIPKLAIYRILGEYYINKIVAPILLTGFKDKNGLEIGGKSSAFTKSPFPIYHIAKNVDNCNFSPQTIWHKNNRIGYTFHYLPNKTGYQYICEATNLKSIPDAAYDFVLSSNTLEHVANPILALKEIKRVLKPDGYFLLILPHKAATFDKKRAVTETSHMIRDYEIGTTEEDLSHFPEIARCNLDLNCWTQDQYLAFVSNPRLNFIQRRLHHHVFVLQNALEIVDYAGFQICFGLVFSPQDIIILCQKKNLTKNKRFLNEKGFSPFNVDKKLSFFLSGHL